jgi:uncharacterized membrane protein YcaP (DUF421 family)
MKPEEIKLGDWFRILFGPVPAEFYIELIIRALIIYVLLMVSMRLLGKRMSGQVSRLDMAALVCLASAIGVPLLSPMNGVLPAFIITALVVGISSLIAYLSTKSEKFESLAHGDLDTLVFDGVLNLDIMKKVRITRERLFAQLRSEKLTQLGAIKRVYMEAGGTFTVIAEEEPKPGLMLIPSWDEDFIKDTLMTTEVTICLECGEQKPKIGNNGNGKTKCRNCGADDWTQAVVETKKLSKAS